MHPDMNSSCKAAATQRQPANQTRRRTRFPSPWVQERETHYKDHRSQDCSRFLSCGSTASIDCVQSCQCVASPVLWDGVSQAGSAMQAGSQPAGLSISVKYSNDYASLPRRDLLQPTFAVPAPLLRLPRRHRPCSPGHT